MLNKDIFSVSNENSPKSKLEGLFPTNDFDELILNELEVSSPETGVYGLVRLCIFERQSSVGLFLGEFFQEGQDISDVRTLVTEAYDACPATYGSSDTRYCPNQCVNAACVVEYIDDLSNNRVSEYTKALIKARYLASITGREDFDRMALSDTRDDLDIILSMYLDFESPCSVGNCGLQDGVEMLVDVMMTYPTYTLTSTDVDRMYINMTTLACAQPNLYECARSRFAPDLFELLVGPELLSTTAATQIIQGFCPEAGGGPIFFPDEVQIPAQIPIIGPEDPSLEVNVFVLGVGECNFPQSLGETEDRNNTADLDFGFSTTNGGGIRFAEPRVLTGFTDPLTNEDLFDKMRFLLTAASTGDLDGVASNIVDFFDTNTSPDAVFEAVELNEAVAASHNMINFVNDVADAFQDELIMGNTLPEIFLEMDGRPRFGDRFNQVNGLTILLNDTEYTSISISNFSQDFSTGEWSGLLCFEIEDHFGLDRPDITGDNASRQYIPPGGFAAWWVLQHQRGQVPFLTRVRVFAQLSGVVNP